jgi:hypothetical protein
MKPLVRTLGVAVLALALMNASAGLCFCHRGPAQPGSPPAAHGCCHGPDTSGRTAVKAAGSCCQIESAESAATPVVAVQLAPPALVATVFTDAAPAADVLPCLAGTLLDRSPPLCTLRI